MIGPFDQVLAVAVDAAFALLVVGMAAAFVRLVRGPSLADRVVALDFIAVLTVAFAGVYAIEAGAAVFLDVAVALALAVFLATVAFARFIERRDARPEPVDAAPDPEQRR